MKLKAIACLSVIFCAFAGAAHAAERGAPTSHETSRLRLEPAVFLPVGDLSVAHGPGVGGLAGFQHQIIPALTLTGRAGYIAGSEKTIGVGNTSLSASLNMLPVLAGARINFLQRPTGPYLAGELGGIFVTERARVPRYSEGTNSEVYFGGYLGLGYDFGIVDLRVGTLTLDLGRPGQTTGVMASIAVNLVSF
jgi:hypothetical protein